MERSGQPRIDAVALEERWLLAFPMRDDGTRLVPDVAVLLLVAGCAAPVPNEIWCLRFSPRASSFLGMLPLLLLLGSDSAAKEVAVRAIGKGAGSE